ncbi:MAG TPA: hypothetical protein VGN19_14165, partial [Pedococcus sp.]|nr:hypothetical protein [Pedococcus sp.]
KDALVLGTNDAVYHTNYFSQLSVIEAIGGWLPLAVGADGGPEAALEAPATSPPPPTSPALPREDRP